MTPVARVITLAIALSVTSPTAVVADFSNAAILAISRVESEGYVIDSVSRTFFGRVKVISHNAEYQRETVFHAVTLEVLQDRFMIATPKGNGSQSGQGSTAPANGGSNGSASTRSSTSNRDFNSQTSGQASGRSPSSNSSSNTTETNSSSTTTNSDGSTTSTNTNTTSTSGRSTATAGD